MSFVEEAKPAKAVGIGCVTLVGYLTQEYPLSHGNCFSLMLDDEGSCRILNFAHENIEKLLELKVVSFPLDVLILQDGFGVLHDARIPNNWYSGKFCETCTPLALLPAPQRLKQLRDVVGRRRVEHEPVEIPETNGKKVSVVSFKVASGHHQVICDCGMHLIGYPGMYIKCKCEKEYVMGYGKEDEVEVKDSHKFGDDNPEDSMPE